MSTVTERSFGINLSGLKHLFLYCPDGYNVFNTTRASVLYISLMFYVPIFGTLYLIVEENINMERLVVNAYVLAEVWCYTVKLLPFITKSEQIKNCIHYFEAPLFATLRRNQRKIIDEYSVICRRNSLIYFTCFSGGFFLWVTKPLLYLDYTLPIDIWIPCNMENNLVVYGLVYLLLVLGSGYPAIASSLIEPLVAGLACLASGYLKVLKDDLTHLYEYTEEELQSDNSKRNEAIYRKIRKCIDYHSSTLNFVKEYEECFSQVVFSQFAGSVFVLGFCCLQLTMLEPFSVNFLQTLSNLGVMLGQIYFYCYYGTSLFEESINLTNAVYMGQWYQYDIKSRKALIILMECSKKPIIVTAGKILDLSLVTFTNILRKSYSLVAVFQKRVNANKY